VCLRIVRDQETLIYWISTNSTWARCLSTAALCRHCPSSQPHSLSQLPLFSESATSPALVSRVDASCASLCSFNFPIQARAHLPRAPTMESLLSPSSLPYPPFAANDSYTSPPVSPLSRNHLRTSVLTRDQR
jgi:hypothetical protein